MRLPQTPGTPWPTTSRSVDRAYLPEALAGAPHLVRVRLWVELSLTLATPIKYLGVGCGRMYSRDRPILREIVIDSDVREAVSRVSSINSGRRDVGMCLYRKADRVSVRVCTLPCPSTPYTGVCCVERRVLLTRNAGLASRLTESSSIHHWKIGAQKAAGVSIYTHTALTVVARDTAAPMLAPSTASSTRHGRLRGIDRLESARLPLESAARHVVSCAWVQAASVGELRVRRIGAESARRSGCEARTAHRAPTSNSDQLAGPRPRASS